MKQNEILNRLIGLANELDRVAKYEEANILTKIASRVAQIPQISLEFYDENIPFDEEWHNKIAATEINGFKRVSQQLATNRLDISAPVVNIREEAEKVNPQSYINYCECGEKLRLHGPRNVCRGCGKVRDIKGQPFQYAIANTRWEEHLRTSAVKK